MDIKETLVKLQAQGVTDGEVSCAIGLSRPAVCYLRNGVSKTTDYPTGKRLEIFAKERGCLVETP